MKHLFLILILFLLALYSTIYAQKPPIDSSVYDKWPTVQSGYISNDGKYISFTIDKQPLGRATSIIRSTEGNWEMESIESGFSITGDSRKTIFKKPNDSLFILTLGTDSLEIIANLKSYRILTNNQDSWLLYYLKDSVSELFVRNLRTGLAKTISSVADYFCENESYILIVKKQSKKNGKVTESMEWVDLRTGESATIWEGTGIVGGVIFDKTYTQASFIIQDSLNGEIQKSIWHYKAGMSESTRLIDKRLFGADSHLQLQYLDHFSEDGTRLFIKYNNEPVEIKKDNTGMVDVDLWSYKDTKLQSQQLYELKNSFPRLYSAVIQIRNQQIFKIEQSGETILGSNDQFAVVYRSEGNADFGESNWSNACRLSFYLVSTLDGVRKQMNEHRLLLSKLSPEGKYLIWYDYIEKNYFSFEIQTGVTKNITKTIRTDWTAYENDHPDAPRSVDALSGWFKNDAAVILHDQNDIWQVDPSGNHSPINLTNGYGLKHHIVFRLAKDDGGVIINPNENTLLSAFNRSSKDNGYYSAVLSRKSDPVLLTMGQYIYEGSSDDQNIYGQAPIKARDKEAYIVQRMSATESPNYFYTTDLAHFSEMSDVHPERKYNWLTSELISWKALDGNMTQGILYKPENFDPKRKYPVIFYFYERLSDELNDFKQPVFSLGRLDIATYVSNGYLVFTPDIYYKIGDAGKGSINSVISAAKWLSKMPWIDFAKMGLQGHSFGGYETNYLVTHSHLFSAACSASGLSDFVSAYGELLDNGPTLQWMFEQSVYRNGATLWERPDIYIKNSSIFNANKVTTPLLMMHTKNDGVCPFANAVEFFTALRRLGKKVWMLQYDNYNHFLLDDAAADFTIRMQQFFDHYLKGAPAPKWMVEGIPASRKGIDDGLELEPGGPEPGPGLLTPEEQKKVDALMHRKPITVTIP